MLNTIALKPCPFCNSANIDAEGWMSCEPDGSDKRTGPACDDCGASAASIDQWNTRAQSDVRATEPKSEPAGQDIAEEIAHCVKTAMLDAEGKFSNMPYSKVVANLILQNFAVARHGATRVPPADLADEVADLTTANVLLHASLRSREEETASLRAQLQEAKEERDDVRSRYVREIAIVNDLSAQLASARKVLEPFAAFAEALNETVPDDISIGIFAGGAMRFGPSGGASVKDLRAARVALTDEEGDSK